MNELLPGIYLLRLPTVDFPPGHANSYLIRGTNDHLLVDVGWDTDDILESLKAQINEIGLDISDIRQIVLTHGHTDHGGLSGKIRHLTGARILMHHLGSTIFSFRFKSDGVMYRDKFLNLSDDLLYLHGFTDEDLSGEAVILPDVLYTTSPDVPLNGGEILNAGEYSFRVIYTPGHSPDHIGLYEPRHKLLIGGDLILPTMLTNTGLHMHHATNPLGDYLDSLKRLHQMDIEMVLPGHEDPFTNVKHRIENIYQRQKRMNNNILGVLTDGIARNAMEITLKLTWSKRTNTQKWPGLNQWDKRFVALENISHLEWMRFNNRVTRFTRNGIYYYHTIGIESAEHS